MLKKIVIISILLVLLGCQQDDTAVWNPIFEETNFEYINTSIERSLALMDEAYSEAIKTDQSLIQEKLAQSKERLLEIKDYYVPLTTVRQKIYDAERYFKLNKIKKSEKLLEDSKTILSSLKVTTKNEGFDKVVLELTSMINEVISTFYEDSKTNTYDKMKKAGEHINLMLFKGELVLSGVKFEK